MQINPSRGVMLRAHESACLTVSVNMTLLDDESAGLPNRALLAARPS